MKIITTLLFILVFSAAACAATFTVTKTNDTEDGVCNADCSLREAIAAASNGDTIVFDQTFFNVQNFILVRNGEINIDKNLTIVGTGARILTIRRDGPGIAVFRVFNNSGTTVISNLTVSNGLAESGGGILNRGSLTLNNVEVSSNTAYSGGGIENRGTLSMTNSAINLNTASRDGFRSEGGGIDNYGTAVLRNVTISGNRALSNGFGAIGGGVHQRLGSNLTLVSATVANNSAVQGIGGGIYAEGGNTQTSLSNTIVADNSANTAADGNDIFGGFSSGGFNFIESRAGGDISGITDGNIFGVDPRFESTGLQTNGGSTRNIALQPTSPAVNKGKSFGSATDQRGLIRPFDNSQVPDATGGDASDIGAFELQQGGCTYSIPFGAFRIDEAGGAFIPVTAPAGCAWTAVSNAPWIIVSSGAAGSGSGFVNYNVPPNFGAARTGTITIAGLLYTVVQSANSRPSWFDFDGDRRADISVFRPSNGAWYVTPSQSSGFYGFPFGAASDQIVPADYDGDGRTDAAVYRAGIWYLQRSQAGFTGIAFGQDGDVPVPSDYDGDGRTDIAVWRPSNGVWYIQRSQLGFTGFQLGVSGDKPLVGDFEGDGKNDAAVWQPSGAVWTIRISSNNQLVQIPFGISTDIPVPADYDGDGVTNIAVFRPSNGTWYTSQNPATNYGAIVFGANGDLPVPADYDGDRRTDTAVFRPSNGAWYLNRTTSGLLGVQFGSGGDKPTPNTYIR